MIVIRGKKVDSAADARVIVRKTASGFSVATQGDVAPFEFDASLLEFAPDIAYLTRNVWGVPTLFWQSEIGHTRDGYSSICLRKKINMSMMQSVYAMFAVEESGESHVLTYGDTYVDGDDIPVTVDENGTETGCDIFERLVPGIELFLRHSRAKVAAIARFNAIDAISGLENQIDLLSSAVALLMAEMPAEKKPAWWDRFASVVAANSSNNLRGENKGIDNVEVEKIKARETQNAFFAKLTGG